MVVVQSKEGRAGMESTCLYDTKHEKRIYINGKGMNCSVSSMSEIRH